MDAEKFEKIEILDVSLEFLSLDYSELRLFLRNKIKENPTVTFFVAIDWTDVSSARKAKAIIDDGRLHVSSITIRATRKQYEEDVNAFESGVKWEEKV